MGDLHPADIFDAVLAQVRQYQAIGVPSALREVAGGRGAGGNIGAEYLADFQKAGEHCLAKSPALWLDIFLLYFVDDGPAEIVMEILGVRPGTFWVTCARIKNVGGPELARRGLYPPRCYRERTIACDL